MQCLRTCPFHELSSLRFQYDLTYCGDLWCCRSSESHAYQSTWPTTTEMQLGSVSSLEPCGFLLRTQLQCTNMSVMYPDKTGELLCVGLSTRSSTVHLIICLVFQSYKPVLGTLADSALVDWFRRGWSPDWPTELYEWVYVAVFRAQGAPPPLGEGAFNLWS
jgi:hypothetical protein